MQFHFLFVLRKLIAWLFAFLSALLPQHLLVAAPESQRCLAPQVASAAEVPPPAQAPTGPAEKEAAAAAPPPE